MKKSKLLITLLLLAVLLLQLGCAAAQPAAEEPAQTTQTAETTEAAEPAAENQVADASDMATVEDVVEEGMTPVYASSLNDGVYDVVVDSSSTMFNIVSCQLTVADGQMTAVMTMKGTGYLYTYMGTGEEAAAASESDYIPYEETADGTHTFTVPVDALDEGIACTAFSKKKEKWYDRTILFRADSLPLEAFAEGSLTTPESLALADGQYTVDVQLEGGSGKASVLSPATMQVENGTVTVTIVWSSSNYDYMKLDDVQYDAISMENGSTFELPLQGFDWKLPVIADTIAMGTPHEVSYTLYFDSATIAPVAD